jgi:hypothetical protein
MLLLCLQGTLRQALDAGLLVNKGSGVHYLPTVLSLAQNIACAMHYLHQVGGWCFICMYNCIVCSQPLLTVRMCNCHEVRR